MGWLRSLVDEGSGLRWLWGSTPTDCECSTTFLGCILSSFCRTCTCLMPNVWTRYAVRSQVAGIVLELLPSNSYPCPGHFLRMVRAHRGVLCAARSYTSHLPNGLVPVAYSKLQCSLPFTPHHGGVYLHPTSYSAHTYPLRPYYLHLTL